MKYRLFFLLLIIIGIETLAQYFLELSSKKQNHLILLAGIISYSLVGLVYYYILKTGDELAIANSLWNAGSGITVTIIGTLLFNQKLKKLQIVGIIISIIGVSLLQ